MKIFKTNENHKISLTRAKKVAIFVVLVFSLDFIFTPHSVLAGQAVVFDINLAEDYSPYNGSEIGQDSLANVINFFNQKLPENKNIEVKWSKKIVITAYNSEPGQTDDSPCITANNFNVCKHGIEDTIAANFLPFGTKVKIPELFGNRVFVVRDRMNRRYQDRVDVWMIDRHDAINFGLKIAKIDILE